MKKMKVIIFIFIINLNFIILFTLGKYEKTETSDKSIAFDSSSFFIGDKMEFKFKTKGTCENIIYYGYHDQFSKVYQFYETQTPFNTLSTNDDIEKENNINYDIKYFTIKKKPTELNGFYGHYLLIKFNCSDKVEIENINPNLSTGVIVAIVFGCIIMIVSISISIYCYRKKKEKKEEENKKEEKEDNKEKEKEEEKEKGNKKEKVNDEDKEEEKKKKEGIKEEENKEDEDIKIIRSQN